MDFESWLITQARRKDGVGKIARTYKPFYGEFKMTRDILDMANEHQSAYWDLQQARLEFESKMSGEKNG